jgi:hypothetical protein
MIRENMGLKVASLLVAALLWFLVIARGQAEVIVEAPIVFTELAEGLEVVEADGKAVVGVEGHERFLKKLVEGDVSVVVSLGGISAGVRRIALTPEMARTPVFLHAESVEPPYIDIRIAKARAKAPARGE